MLTNPHALLVLVLRAHGAVDIAHRPAAGGGAVAAALLTDEPGGGYPLPILT